MNVGKKLAISDLLQRAGIVDSAGIELALKYQEEHPVPFCAALAALGISSEEETVAIIAKFLQLGTLDSGLQEIAGETTTLLPSDFCHKRMVVPLDVAGSTLRLAMADPLDYSTIQDVEFCTNKRVIVVVASASSVKGLLTRIYPPDLLNYDGADSIPSLGGEIEALAETEFELTDPAKLAKDVKTPPVIRLVNLILSGAAKEGASDIHLEPKENHLQIRQRVDGLLHEVMKVPKNHEGATISRIKILSGMDIAERRRPQDGRSRLRFEGKRIDLRVSTLPTQFGEKVVIRLLDSRRAQITMDQLDFSPENLNTFKSLLSRPQGMILVTGPTGSGKSSTLYTALNWVKSPTKNIITVEDPIEYQLEGVNQVQINTKAGITFAAGLRSILRQDPNVILIGEIRDQETAGIALEAAQTGHLLLSTVHTNDSASTISRLLDLGIEPFLVASAVIGVLAQRLVRRPCPACVISRSPKAETMESLAKLSSLPLDGKWAAGAGCPECKQSGYKGRLGIHELFAVNEEICDLIARRAPDHEIRKSARTGGMRTLLEDGILKAAQGLTTLDEVLRVATAGDIFPSNEETSERSGPQEAIEEDESTTSAKKPRAGEAQSQETVLVVEDSKVIRSVVRYYLELEGFAVVSAKDGNAGLEMAKRHRPHVIITDFNMPGMDGITLVRELRSDPITKGIAIVMLTSEASVDTEAQALSTGADDYILKPIEPRRLAARVRAVLTRSRARATVETV